MIRCSIVLLALVLCAGCNPATTETDDSNAATANGEGQGTGLVGGLLIAPSDAMDAVAGGGGGAVPEQNNPPQGSVPAQPQQQDVIQPRRPADLVDKPAAMAANPDLVEVENHVNASDPFSSAAQSYFSLASRIHVLNLQHQLNLLKNLDENNEYPSFEKFRELLVQSGVELNGLKANQVYAYDQSTGSICILEDQNPDN